MAARPGNPLKVFRATLATASAHGFAVPRAFLGSPNLLLSMDSDLGILGDLINAAGFRVRLAAERSIEPILLCDCSIFRTM